MAAFVTGVLTTVVAVGIALVITEYWEFRAAWLRGRRATRRPLRGCAFLSRRVAPRHRRLR